MARNNNRILLLRMIDQINIFDIIKGCQRRDEPFHSRLLYEILKDENNLEFLNGFLKLISGRDDLIQTQTPNIELEYRLMDGRRIDIAI